MLSNRPRPARVASVPAPQVMPVTVVREAPPAPMSSAPRDPWESHILRRLFLYFALATLFVRLTTLPEVIAYLTNTNTYLLYFVAPPAILGTILMGGIRRTFRASPTYLWMAFFLWMVVAVPFSTWKGGSTQSVMDYGRVNLVFLILAGGLAITWKDIRLTFYTIAAAAVVTLLESNLLMDEANGRIELKASGTIGNSNDLAAHLLLLLPFLLFLVLGRGRPMLLRIAGLGLIGYGLWVILGTASRGALIALFLVLLCILFRASVMQRVAILVIAIVLGAGVMVVLPGQTLARLGSLFGEEHKEADESAESRWYLFKTSVLYTIQHPIFGVGPDQFADYEGQSSLAEGKHGNWHATHNAFTQVSSECGIPALLFFVGALVSACRLVIRTYNRAKREGYPEIANACFCYLLAMVGYLGSLVFLAEAYSFKLLVMVGLSVALSFAANRQMKPVEDKYSRKGPVAGRTQFARPATI